MYELNDQEFIAAIEQRLVNNPNTRLEAYQWQRLVALAKAGLPAEGAVDVPEEASDPE
jgi:hypothetical protein